MAERINYLTELNDRMVGDHLFRYWLAYNEIKGTDFVVEVGCGMGFGTDLLWKKAHDLDAYDYSEEAVNYANEHFLFPAIERDIDLLSLPPDLLQSPPKIDVLVAFEVLEHLNKPEQIIKCFAFAQKVIISVPIIPTKHTNSFHKQDFTEEQVLSWFSEMKIKWTRKQHDNVYLIVCAEQLS